MSDPANRKLRRVVGLAVIGITAAMVVSPPATADDGSTPEQTIAESEPVPPG